MEDDQTFRLEEYKSLRKEIELYLSESRSQERYTLIAVGAIWAWLVINRLTSAIFWSVPILLTLATSLRMVAIMLHFGNLRDYIRTLEDKFNISGWEHKKKGWTLGGAYVLLSVLLLALTIAAFFYRFEITRLPCPVCPKP